MSESGQTVAEILDNLEDLETDFPDLSKDETVRILTQEEDFFTGITAFNNAVEQIEDHRDRGAEIEGIDYGQIIDDRLVLHDRYAEKRESGVQLWDTGQILDDILANEPGWLGEEPGQMSQLVHLHPQPDGGLLLDKTAQIKDARIAYPDGTTGTPDVTLDYDQIRQEARQGSIAAIEQKGLKADLNDLKAGQDYTHEQLAYIAEQVGNGGNDGGPPGGGTGGTSGGNGWGRREYGLLAGTGIMATLSACFGLAAYGESRKNTQQHQSQGTEPHATAEPTAEPTHTGNGQPDNYYEDLDALNAATDDRDLTYREVEAFADSAGYTDTESFDFQYSGESVTVLTEDGEKIGTIAEDF